MKSQLHKSELRPTIILKKRVSGLSERKLGAFVTAACDAAGLPGTVTVMVTGSREMRMLNDRFRRKNRATDVLSFPSPAFVNGFTGDIAVSLDIAAQNARELGHSISDEVRVLVLHGILHLAGFDHEQDSGEMARQEVRLRRQFGLPVALIERNLGNKPRGVLRSQA